MGADATETSLSKSDLDLLSTQLDIELKRRELQSKSRGLLAQAATNPITLAIVGGLIAALTSIVTGYFTAAMNRDLEDQKLQAELIKKFVEGPNRAIVRENLQFLVDSNLVPNYRDDIEGYLKKNPESAPQVGNKPEADNAVPVSSLPADTPLAKMAASVGRVSSVMDGRTYVCTGFMVAPDVVITAGFCLNNALGVTFSIGDQERRAVITTLDVGGADAATFGVLKLDTPVANVPLLALSHEPPAIDEPLSIVMVRGSIEQMADGSPNCRVSAVEPTTFVHHCDTGPGASGAPVVRTSTGEVVGIHTATNLATRVDAITPADLP